MTPLHRPSSPLPHHFQYSKISLSRVIIHITWSKVNLKKNIIFSQKVCEIRAGLAHIKRDKETLLWK